MPIISDREVATHNSDCNGAIAKPGQLDEEKGYVEKQVSFLADSSSSGKMVFYSLDFTTLRFSDEQIYLKFNLMFNFIWAKLCLSKPFNLPKTS